MTEYRSLVALRRSHRKYKEQEIDGEAVRLIMRAALMSPTSKSRRSWQFVLVDDKDALTKLSEAKSAGAQFIKDAPLAVVVCGDSKDNDCWIEDCSIAAMSMMCQAEELGLGSCWVQMRGRGLSDGTMAEEVIRGIVNLPEDLSVLCVIAIGHKADERKPQTDDKLKWENVHIGQF